MHDRVGDRLPECGRRVFGNLLAPQTLDPVGEAGVALDEAQAVFDVRDHAPREVLAVQDVELVGSLEEQAGDVGLVEEPPDLTREEEDSGVAEQQPAARALSGLDVDQDVFGAGPASDAAQSQPGIVLLAALWNGCRRECRRTKDAGGWRRRTDGSIHGWRIGAPCGAARRPEGPCRLGHSPQRAVLRRMPILCRFGWHLNRVDLLE